MKDDLSRSGLREEWSLLVHSFLEDDTNQTELVKKMQNSELSVERIKSIKKEFSSRRKKLYQSIEKIKIKIDQLNVVMENLTLVGSDISGLEKEINFLNHEGEKISEEIFVLDNKIKKIHELQDLSLS